MKSSSLKSSTTERHDEVPHDHFATLYFLSLGGAAACGWNAGINCLDYFEAKFPEANVQFAFPLPPYIAQLIAVLLMAKLSDVFSYTTRIVSSLIGVTLITATLPFEAALFKDSEYGVVMILAMLFVLGFSNTLCYASLAGLTSQIEAKYTAYFLIGTAINSLLMNLFREVTLLLFKPETEEDILCVGVYFGLTVLYLLFCLILHFRFMKSNFYKSRFDVRTSRRKITCDLDPEINVTETLIDSNEEHKGFRMMGRVFKRIGFYVFLLMVSYIQLLMTIPGLMLKKEIPNISNSAKTVSMLAAFNVFFIVGKKLGQYRQYYNKYIILALVLFRFIFVALFIAQAMSLDLPFINTVWFAYVNIALFGVTLGIVNVALFILGPEQVKPEQKEVAGFLSVLGINVGLILGAILALPFRNIGIITPDVSK